MEVAILLLNQIVQLFLMILMGILLVKSGVLRAGQSKSLSVVVLYIVMPCVIIHAFQVDYTKEIRNGLLLALLAAVIIHLIMLLVTEVLSRLCHMDAVEKVSVIYSNSGNLIIPIVTGVLGEEWVIYSSAFMCVQLILMWTHGKSVLCGEKGGDLKKILTNVNMIAILLGIVLFLLRIKLPSILEGTVASVSSMVGPISMIITGMLIGGMSLKKIVGYHRVWLMTFFRMILIPAIILIVLKVSGLSGLHPDGDTILLISFLASITPAASTMTQMAQIYGKDADYASVINVVTTVVCIITMPLMVLIY
ncbi:MAG TPA: AEC family transporter [Candidatus Onthocola gallistercoris]|uniref:AEC family transporter n=1 Tax=Candidatus Onthocola gallistercoris TaxID=2840876 RepID=A0A9D1HF81_9FIRM|nr:AEC family transporter [Candidatus Onthocola gallistercoris]